MAATPNEEQFTAAFAEIFGKVSGEELPADFSLDTPVEQLAIDSMGRMELAGALEDHFGTRIDDESLRNAASLRDIYAAAIAGSRGD
jgi:acyl carrier protein